jgi:glycosyltransferase involved in cell wall biosynthesis
MRADRHPDVVHFHAQPEGALLTRGLPARKLLSFDNYFFRRSGSFPLHPIYRQLLRQFDLLLPCSDYCRDQAAAYWRLPAEDMRVLYNGVNVSQFAPDPEAGARRRAELGLRGRTLLYVGRVCEQKGTDLLLAAYRVLRARRPDVHLVVVGPIGQFGRGARDDAGWAARLRDAGATYVGPVAEAALASYYNLADVFVMPTRELEMFGMAAVEAQAAGKPVVASDHGGLRETVPAACGARFPVGDAAALADRVDRLLADDAAYATAADNAIRNAERFSWARICDTLETCYTGRQPEPQAAVTC